MTTIALERVEAPAAGALPGLDRPAIARILDAGRGRPDGLLLETEAMALLDAIGIATPRRLVLRDAAAAEHLVAPPFPGLHTVLKVLAPGLAHKTEAGGVRVV